MKKRRNSDEMVLKLSLILKNRQMFLRDIEDHLNSKGLMSLADFHRLQDKYSPKNLK